MVNMVNMVNDGEPWWKMVIVVNLDNYIFYGQP